MGRANSSQWKIRNSWPGWATIKSAFTRKPSTRIAEPAAPPEAAKHLRVLITNLFVSHYSGSENVVQLLAAQLRRAGHAPVLFAPLLGPQAEDLRAQGFEVVDRIDQVTLRPDVIHAQHLTPALIAMTRFREVPVVYTCHSSTYEIEAPMLHPQIRSYVAVDEKCAETCRARGVPDDRLSVILNAVDMQRFQRRPPLPDRPLKALVLAKNRQHLETVRQACSEAGLALDEAGPATSRVIPDLESALGGYDLVFATARMALEAAAVGCAVIVCDGRGFAGMLSSTDLPAWRPMNFGIGILTEPVTVENLHGAIARYDAADAALVTDALRRTADAGLFLERYLELYRRAIAGVAPAADDVALANARWTEELTVTTAPRTWAKIGSELNLEALFPAR